MKANKTNLVLTVKEHKFLVEQIMTSGKVPVIDVEAYAKQLEKAAAIGAGVATKDTRLIVPLDPNVVNAMRIAINLKINDRSVKREKMPTLLLWTVSDALNKAYNERTYDLEDLSPSVVEANPSKLHQGGVVTAKLFDSKLNHRGDVILDELIEESVKHLNASLGAVGGFISHEANPSKLHQGGVVKDEIIEANVDGATIFFEGKEVAQAKVFEFEYTDKAEHPIGYKDQINALREQREEIKKEIFQLNKSNDPKGTKRLTELYGLKTEVEVRLSEVLTEYQKANLPNMEDIILPLGNLFLALRKANEEALRQRSEYLIARQLLESSVINLRRNISSYRALEILAEPYRDSFSWHIQPNMINFDWEAELAKGQYVLDHNKEDLPDETFEY